MSNLGWFTSSEKLGIPDLWTPAMIDTALWLDAADESTFTLVSGKVSEWRDKSGKGRHVAQGTDSLRPTRSGSKVIFGGSHWLQNTVAQLPLTTFLLSLVFRETTAVTNAGAFSVKGSGADWNSTNGFTAGPGNKITGRFNITGSTSGTFDLKDPRTPAGACPLAIHTISKVELSGSIYVDGTFYETDSSFTAFSTLSAGGFALGARQSPAIASPYLIGEIMEIVYAPVADTRKLEGYLAHKWGLAK